MSEVSPHQEALTSGAFERANIPPTLEVKGIISAKDPSGEPFCIVKAGEETPIGNGDAVMFRGLCVGEPMERVPTAFGIEPELEPRVISTKAKLLMAACLGMVALSACEQGHSASDDAIEQMLSQLTMDDLGNLSPQQLACFTQPGDRKPSIGIFNGETVITFVRENPETGKEECNYVKAADILTAVEQACEAKVIEIPGPNVSVMNCAIGDGNIYFIKGIDDEKRANLTEVNGNLLIEGVPETVEGDILTSTATVIYDSGIPHLLYSDPNGAFIKQNLVDGTTQTFPYNAGKAGIPHKDADSDTWVGGKLVNYGGVEHKLIVKSATPEGLMSSLQFVPVMVGNDGIIGTAINPRIMGNVMIFQGDDGTGNQIWYAVFNDPTVNPDVGPDVQEQDLGEQDTGVLPDLGDPDTGVLPDLGDPDTGVLPDLGDPDTGVEPDLGDPDTGVLPDLGDPDTGVEPDIAELPDTQVEPEDTAEPSDTSIPGDESSGPEEISQPNEISDASDAAEEAWKEIVEIAEEAGGEISLPDEFTALDEFTVPDEAAQADEASTPDKGQKDHGALPEDGPEQDVVGKDLPGQDNSGPEVSTGTPGGGCSTASEAQGQTRNSIFVLLAGLAAIVGARLRRKKKDALEEIG